MVQFLRRFFEELPDAKLVRSGAFKYFFTAITLSIMKKASIMKRSERNRGIGIAFSQFLHFFLLKFWLARDCHDVEKLDVFQYCCYMKCYLNDLTAHQIALIHYILIGERQGAKDINRTPFLIRNIKAAQVYGIAGPRLLPNI